MPNKKYFEEMFVVWGRTPKLARGRYNDVESKLQGLLPLAFLTPDGDNAAARKRKDTALYWAEERVRMGRIHTNQRNNPTPDMHDVVQETYQNIPVTGFEFVDSTSRMTTQNKWLRIADPRGFVVEISVANALEIMKTTLIDHGVVQDACFWAREGAQNVLVPADQAHNVEGSFKLTGLSNEHSINV